MVRLPARPAPKGRLARIRTPLVREELHMSMNPEQDKAKAQNMPGKPGATPGKPAAAPAKPATAPAKPGAAPGTKPAPGPKKP